jgi:hypothetical protein
LKITSALTLRVATFLFIGLGIVSFISIIWYQTTGLRADFFHESAFPLLYSESNIQNSNLYDPSFRGREISPISWPAFGSLILLMNGGVVSLSAHIIYAVSFSVCFLLACIWFVKTMKFSPLASGVFITLIFTVFTFPPGRYVLLDQVWVWPMNSYGVQDLFSLICATILAKVLSRIEPSMSGWLTLLKDKFFILLTVCMFVLGFNGIRGVLMVGGGILFGVLLEILQTKLGQTNQKLKGPLSFLLIILVGVSVVSAVWTTYAYQGVPQPWQEAHQIITLSSPSDLVNRVVAYIWSWVSLFGAIPPQTEKIYSLASLFAYFKLAFSLGLLYVAYRKIRNVNRSENQMERILTYRLGFIFLVTFAAALLTDTAGTPRYLIPLYFSIVFLVPFWVDTAVEKQRASVIVALSIMLIPLAIISSFKLTANDTSSYKSNSVYSLAKHLESQGLTKGFVTPWESDALSVNQFSEGNVRVQVVDVTSDGISQHGHSNDYYFSPENLDENTFFVVPTDLINGSVSLSDIRSASQGEERWGTWTILKFDTGTFLANINR